MSNIAQDIWSFIRAAWRRPAEQIQDAGGDIGLDLARERYIWGSPHGMQLGDDILGDLLRVDSDLIARYVDYETMDDYSDCSTALDIYADDATVIDPRHKRTLWVECADKQIQQDLAVMFDKRVRLEDEAWSIIRSLCKYGNDFEEVLVLPGKGVIGLNHLPAATMRRVEDHRGTTLGFIQSVKGDFGINGVSRKPEDWKFENGIAHNRMDGSALFEDWRVVHMRLRAKDRMKLYGASILEPARWVFKRLMLLEDAAFIYRLTRSPQRMGIYVDVGKLAPEDAEKALDAVRQRLKKKKLVNPRTGKIDFRFNALSVDEDLFLPVRDGREKIRVEPLNNPSWQCLHGDTVIPLLNGDRVSIRDLAEKYSNETFWVYSINKDGEIVPGKAHNARKTGRKRIWRVRLDNGEIVRCSGNHPWLLRNGEYRQTRELQIGDKLMPWSVNLKKNGDRYYERVYNPADGEWIYTHRLVARCMLELNDKMVVHHKDGNGWNNDPENLVVKSRSKHSADHANACWRDGKYDMRKLSVRTLKLANTSRTFPAIALGSLRAVCPDNRESCHVGSKWRREDASLDDLSAKILLAVNSGVAIHGIKDVIRETGYSQNLIYRLCRDAGISWPDFAAKSIPGWIPKGYALCREHRRKYMYRNHTVVSVEETDEWADMYDISVATYHNFAIQAGVFVHNSVSDIEYFLRKLYAALKVPRGYVGYDENMPSRATLSQQDVRFAKTVLRIQREFKNGMKRVAMVHLAANGIDPMYVDFDLVMTVPSAIFELGQLEVEQARAGFAQQMEAYVSRHWILSKIFGLGDEEIAKIMEQRKDDDLKRGAMDGMAAKFQDGSENPKKYLGLADDSKKEGGQATPQQGTRRPMVRGPIPMRQSAHDSVSQEKILLEGNREHEKRLEDKLDEILDANTSFGRFLNESRGLMQEIRANMGSK